MNSKAISGGMNSKRPRTGSAMLAGACGLSLALLSGCNTSAVLTPNPAPGPQTDLATDATAMASTPENQTAVAALTTPEPQQQPGTQSALTGTRIQFAPVIGAPSEATPPLSRRLEARARESGITLVNGAGASIVMKGYFSAIADGGKTTVIYVWDVLDASGNRLHRIQGQAAAPGARGDGWSSVTAPTMEAIADATMNQLSAWLAQQQG